MQMVRREAHVIQVTLLVQAVRHLSSASVISGTAAQRHDGPLPCYQHLVAAGVIWPDPAQHAAVSVMQVWPAHVATRWI